MIWHVLTRIGAADNYDPPLGPGEPRIHVAFDKSGDRWLMSNNAFRLIAAQTARLPAAAAADMLYLAMAIYAGDLRIPRRLAADRWCREIMIHLPVQDLALWSQHAGHVERTLNFLTGDTWTLRLRQRDPIEPQIAESKVGDVQAACLFSGGLDSLVGTLDLLADGNRVALVGHHGSGITNPVQERVLKAVTEKYGKAVVPFMFHAQPPKGNIKDGEPSMRSRSFLFFTLASTVVGVLNAQVPLVIAENGLISLNVPLTSARTGSRSTRTTHPHYIAMFIDLLQRLGLPHALEMPYRLSTKGEMLRGCKDQALLATCAKLTMSCSHPESGRYRGLSPTNHCGYCVPCIIRKAAMKAASVEDSAYNIDIETAPPAYTEEAGRDYRAFCMGLERLRGLSSMQTLSHIMASGPLPPEDVRQFADMYRRGMEEVRCLLGTGTG